METRPTSCQGGGGMTATTHNLRRKTSLQLSAGEIGHVSEDCQDHGIPRATFYDLRRPLPEGWSRRFHGRGARAVQTALQSLHARARGEERGCGSVAASRRATSGSCVSWKASCEQVLMLNERQIRFLERRGTELGCGHVETSRSGDPLDRENLSTLSGKGGNSSLWACNKV